MKRKVVSLMLVSAMVAGMLAGCGSDSGSSKGGSSTETGSAAVQDLGQCSQNQIRRIHFPLFDIGDLLYRNMAQIR